jgi:hypothetical protein
MTMAQVGVGGGVVLTSGQLILAAGVPQIVCAVTGGAAGVFIGMIALDGSSGTAIREWVGDIPPFYDSHGIPFPDSRFEFFWPSAWQELQITSPVAMTVTVSRAF